MKKSTVITLSTLIIVLLITGCGCNKSKEIDKNEKVNNKINSKIQDMSLGDSKIFEGLIVLNDNTLETQLGINRNFVENHAIGISMYNNFPKLYMIIKPKKENKKIVKQALDLYLNKIKENVKDDDKPKYEKALKQEYNGYYVYIVSDDNEKVFSKIKEYLK